MSMESTTPEQLDESTGVKTFFSFYSKYLWNRLAVIVPSSDSKFLAKFSKLWRHASRLGSTRQACLPLPLPSNSLDSHLVMKEGGSRVFDVLEDIMAHTFTDLHIIQKNLQFWQSRAEGTNGRNVYFMVFERGPRAFFNQAFHFLRELFAESSSKQRLSDAASAYIYERIAVLTALRSSIATFLAGIYTVVDRCGEDLLKDPEKSFSSLLITINSLLSDLEASIGHLHASRQSNSSVDGSYSFPLLFEKLPEVKQEDLNWSDSEIQDAIHLVYENLDKLDSYVTLMVAKHQRPRKVTVYWIRYTCGAVGLSVCSLWLLRHSRLMGSSDIDNWIQEAKNSTVSFLKDHVEQPLLSIRDELFETFKKRDKGVMEIEEVHLTANSLHRMLLAFTEQTKGEKFPEDSSDQKMLEIVMARYEKELTHPIQNLLSGELARALLIQVQKLKLDIETAMLELDQILRANEINFAILAALPAFFLSLILLMLARAWLKRDTIAEGRGRIARVQRRLLVVEVEKRIMQYQSYIDQGKEKEAQSTYGLVLYTLDQLYHAVERHAKATGEWQCLRQDIVDLGKPGLQPSYKLIVTSRMERVYDCLLPSLKRQ